MMLISKVKALFLRIVIAVLMVCPLVIVCLSSGKDAGVVEIQSVRLYRAIPGLFAVKILNYLF